MAYFMDSEDHISDDAIYFVPVKPKPCPICGKYDGLYINSEKHYNKLLKENGGACLLMGCKECDIDMKVYDHVESNNDYKYMRGVLIKKWNRRAE